MTLSHSSSLADPSGSGALIAAVAWLQGTILGTVATTVAIVAVASVGFLMLSGRIDVRRGVTVILGCFVLFGALSVVAGVSGLAEGSVESPVIPVEASPPIVSNSASTPNTSYDPYAGASVR